MRRAMKLKIFIIIFFIVQSLPLLAREYEFAKISNFKTIQLYGKFYNVVKTKYINLNQHKELASSKEIIRKKSRYRKEIGETYIVLTKMGILVRDNDIIEKALFTKPYTQLTNYEFEKITTPIKEIIANYDKAIKKLKLRKGQQYFSSLKPLIYLIHEDDKVEVDLSLENKKQLMKFNELILSQPVKGLKITLIEILQRSKELSQKCIKLLRKKRNKIVSFEEALEIDQLRYGLVYGSSTSDFINGSDIQSIQELEMAEEIAEELLEKYKKQQLFNKQENMIKLLSTMKRVFHQVYEEEDVFTELVDYMDQARAIMIKHPKRLKKRAVYSSRYFPYYKSNYGQFSIPEDIKEEYETVLFYDDFTEDLKRWLVLGPTNSFIKNNTLNTNGNGWYPSGVSSRVLFNPHSGNTYIESKVKIGEGKGSFGFGEKKLGNQGKKGVLPFIGFIFNQSVEGSGSVDFRINNEIAYTQFRVMVDLKRIHKFKLKLHQNDGIDFHVDNKKVYHHSFRSTSFGSESVVLSSSSNDYSWIKIIVYQEKD